MAATIVFDHDGTKHEVEVFGDGRATLWVLIPDEARGGGYIVSHLHDFEGVGAGLDAAMEACLHWLSGTSSGRGAGESVEKGEGEDECASCTCPVCGSDSIEGGDFDVEGDTVSQNLFCLDCDSSWTSYYKFSACTVRDD